MDRRLVFSADGCSYNCTRAIKDKGIHVYDRNILIFDIAVLNDFSGYTLTDEDGNPAEFSAPELDEITQLQLAMAELYEGVLGNG